MPPAPPLLELTGIAKRYGGVRALKRGTLVISAPGVVHGLIGENGSGKSTILGIMSGQVRPDEGSIRLNGEAMQFVKPLDAIGHGIAMVSQETALAPDLSVAENILLGHRAERGPGGIDWPATRRKAAEVLARLDLDIDPEQLAGTLSPDRQQMIEIARAISMDARILILDEPTSSLTDDQVRVLFKTIAVLKAQGVSVVFVSHRLAEMFEIVDELTVLRDGETAASGPMSEFDVQRIVDEMVGRAGAWEEVGVPERRARVSHNAAPVLEVSELNVEGIVRDASLTVAPGEIVGVAGLVGSGRRELLEALFGARSVSSGELALQGKPYTPSNPRSAIARGMGYLPPDRKLRGLVLGRSIRDNLTMSVTAFLPRLRSHSRAQTEDVVQRVMSGMRVRAESPEVAVGTLSGGNQQKVALGKWLAAGSTVLLLDEPTRGVDVAAKAEIHSLLREAAESNAALLVSSSENEELIALCDRILVMFRGAIIASVPSADASEALLSRYTGGHLSE
ncbi:sugar ABC transporter ATP-binding protein [Leucobacter sp. USHLN153]|uniref:sugar ABC transporter ATP-binding protein n=1 Tax=Leucobacter sp. USHLN153 TaxID=3081268 RepID=UPI003017D62B